jgi:hypothetical protein
MLEGSYYRNLGEFGEIYNKAGGGYLSYGKHFSNLYHVIFKTGYTSFSFKNKTLGDSAKALGALPLLIGGRYYVLHERIMPYFSFINGFNLVFQDVNIEGKKDEQTLLRYSWQAGFGVVFKVIKELNVDLNAKYNNNFYHPDAMMTSLEYGLGVSYNIMK